MAGRFHDDEGWPDRIKNGKELCIALSVLGERRGLSENAAVFVKNGTVARLGVRRRSS
jgi:hypothetical protein